MLKYSALLFLALTATSSAQSGDLRMLHGTERQETAELGTVFKMVFSDVSSIFWL